MEGDNPALIERQMVDCGDYVEITEIWDITHPDCPFVRFDLAFDKDKYAAVQYIEASSNKSIN